VLTTAFIRRVLLSGLFGALACHALRADPGPEEELARVKAAYLYHFAAFTEWPESAVPIVAKEIRLCVLGDGVVEAQVRRLNGKELEGGRLLRVVQARREELPKFCHMVFVGEPARVGLDPAWIRLRGAPLLSVSDQAGFAQGGGMIEMFLRDDKVRMRINLGAVRSAGLHLSSKLLRLAEIVETP
jgi:hypothetical protein